MRYAKRRSQMSFSGSCLKIRNQKPVFSMEESRLTIFYTKLQLTTPKKSNLKLGAKFFTNKIEIMANLLIRDKKK